MPGTKPRMPTSRNTAPTAAAAFCMLVRVMADPAEADMSFPRVFGVRCRCGAEAASRLTRAPASTNGVRTAPRGVRSQRVRVVHVGRRALAATHGPESLDAAGGPG